MAKKHKKDPKDWKIKRHRDGDKHIQACNSGYHKAGKTFRQVHHILPVTCLSDARIADAVAQDADRLDVIKNCLKLTDWDINAAPNCVGLPLKPAYHHKRAPAGWAGWPSHQVDHPPYTDEVHVYLQNNVWDPISMEAEACAELGDAIAAALNAGSDHWRGQLRGRGQRPIGPNGGTAYCWQHRADPGMETLWYLPFSMAAVPTRRSPPADFEAFEGSMKAYLRKIFAALG